jgi:hypothetical protein
VIPNEFDRFITQPNHPDFLDLPWNTPLSQWNRVCSRLEELPRGLSRHIVVFVRYEQNVYAIKQLPAQTAELEYQNLKKMELLLLPSVLPVGYGEFKKDVRRESTLITKYLPHSLPYRYLLSRPHFIRYREHLLDAIASLLVQLHLAGVYWGDCSLSNTLFIRDAGVLQAYLVDAETSEVSSTRTDPTDRFNDLQIMEHNIDRELMEIGLISEVNPNNAEGSSIYIHQQYLRLWNEITDEIMIYPGETYRIQERIRKLNELGFSVGEIEFIKTEGGNKYRLHVGVTDRYFHRNQLYDLTGMLTEEMQARSMINEIFEVKAYLAHQSNKTVDLKKAAQYWLEKHYYPTIDQLKPHVGTNADYAESYCQILENKWYLSERAQQDVGHQLATDNFIQNHFYSSNS